MAYSGRRGPNVSAYIANLNAIPSAQDLHNSAQDDFNLDDDLAMFTNTQFFDYDHDMNGQGGDGAFDGLGGQSVADGDVDLKGLDFGGGDFTFPDFNFSPTQPGTGSTYDHATNNNNNNNISHGHAPSAIQTSIYPPPSTTTSSPPSGLISPQTGLISPSDTQPKTHSHSHSHSPTEPYEDTSRILAEEDKRRRNTAASARFRVKKKQREQALERSAKEMSDKVAALEGRINQLETENKWLKNLITEKNDGTEDVAALYRKHIAEKVAREAAERKTGGRKEGVGTKA